MTIHTHPAIVHMCQMSKTKIQPKDQSSRISKPCSRPMHHYAGVYYSMYDWKTSCTEQPHPTILT